MSGFFTRGDEHPLDAIERDVAIMLAHVTTTLQLAGHALFGEAAVEEVASDLRATDREVNLLEQEVRRALVVHIAVAGPADAPAMLTYMSVVKDVERIGDYAKNLLDLAELGVDLSRGDDGDQLRGDFDNAVALVPRAAEVFAERDEDGAQALLQQVETLLERANTQVDTAVSSDLPGHHAAPRALFHRYLKRVVAHTANLLSGVVMPVDRLDYFDEDVEDRLPPRND